MELSVKIISDVTDVITDAPYIIVDHHKLRSISKMYDRRIEFSGKIESSILVDLTIEELNILEEIIMKNECIYSSDNIASVINVCDYMNIPNDVCDKIISIDPNKIVLDWYDCVLVPNKFDASTVQFIENYINKQSLINIDIFQTPLHVLNSKSVIIHKFIAKQLFYTFISADITNCIDDRIMSVLNMINTYAIESSDINDDKTAALEHFADTIINIIRPVLEQNMTMLENGDFNLHLISFYLDNKDKFLRLCHTYCKMVNCEFSIDIFTNRENLLELSKCLLITLKTQNMENNPGNIFFPSIELYDKLVNMLKSIDNLSAVKNIIKFCPWIPRDIIHDVIEDYQYDDIIKSMTTLYSAEHIDPLEEIDEIDESSCSHSSNDSDYSDTYDDIIRGDFALIPGKDTILPNGLELHVESIDNMYVIQVETSRPLLLCIKQYIQPGERNKILSGAPNNTGIIIYNNFYCEKIVNNYTWGRLLPYGYIPINVYGSKIIIPVVCNIFGNTDGLNENIWICYAEYL